VGWAIAKRAGFVNRVTGMTKRRQIVEIARTQILKALCGLRRNKAVGSLTNPIVARIILEMAQTGIGTDECLELGCLPVPVHFYSPIPDLKDLEQRKVWDRRSGLLGIDFRPQEQEALLLQLGKNYGQECRWPEQPTNRPFEFHTHNGCFGFGCAAGLHCMIRHLKPQRIIEVGSGFSSLVISSAIRLNSDESSQNCDYTIVDPYPRDDHVPGTLPGLTRLIRDRVELLSPSFFDQLAQNDILFIDSSHVSKIGSDVNFLILDVLPRLAPGVAVHFHDIDLPYEYPKVYATNPTFRMFWTEAYLLQAFLTHNDRWEILLGMAYLMKERINAFCSAFPYFDLKRNWANSGSFWIRRKTDLRHSFRSSEKGEP